MANSSSFGTPDSELPDGSWPIFDKLSLTHCIRDYERLVAHSEVRPEDVIVERIPQVRRHIIARALALDMLDDLPFELRQHASGAVLNVLCDDIAILAEELAQLARDNRSSSSNDGGAG